MAAGKPRTSTLGRPSGVVGTGMVKFTPCCSGSHIFPGVHTSKPPAPLSKHAYFVVERFHLVIFSKPYWTGEIAQWVRRLPPNLITIASLSLRLPEFSVLFNLNRDYNLDCDLRCISDLGQNINWPVSITYLDMGGHGL